MMFNIFYCVLKGTTQIKFIVIAILILLLSVGDQWKLKYVEYVE